MIGKHCRASLTKALVVSTLIKMADDRQQIAKESKGIRNRLKKALRLGSRSKYVSKLLEFAFNHCCSPRRYRAASCSHTCCNNWPRRSCETPSHIHPLSYSCYREGERWKNNAAKAGVQHDRGTIHLRRGQKPGELLAYRDIPLSSFPHQQLEPTSQVPALLFLRLH